MAKYRKLSRTSDQRKALLRSQVTSLLYHGKIVTTEAKAKEIEVVYGAIKNSQPDDKLVALKTLESLEKVADGQANKVFIPFDATKALAGLGSLKEITKD